MAQPPPSYPSGARKRGLIGTVSAIVTVESTGSVKKVQILKSQPPFDAPVELTLSQWRFEPIAGPAGVETTWKEVISVDFRLPDSGILDATLQSFLEHADARAKLAEDHNSALAQLESRIDALGPGEPSAWSAGVLRTLESASAALAGSAAPSQEASDAEIPAADPARLFSPVAAGAPATPPRRFELVVDPRGLVTRVRPLSDEKDSLERNAIAAAWLWRFREGAEPVRVTVAVPFARAR